ncbi:MAG: hypothetical protein LBH93_01040 [Chitinispirillales bacterium]|nr:hypothetical protein [Chitinispirillales bacterium]
MSVGKVLGRVGIVLAAAVTVAIGQTPASVKIGNQTWTKQNLNVKTQGSWCYEDKESNCAKYGRLYTWEAAKTACASMGGKWRLPTKQDWDNLVGYAGGEDVAGKKLKSAGGWNRCDEAGDCVANGNGTDEFGFSALPGGERRYSGGHFEYAGKYGLWWSASEYDAGHADRRLMNYNDGNVYGGYDDKSFGFSVRCVGVAQD